MNQKLILENWRKFLKEEVDEITKLQQQTSQEMTSNTTTKPQPTEEEKTEATKETIIGSVEHSLFNAVATAKKNGISPSQIKVDLQKSLNDLVKEEQTQYKPEEGSTKGVYNAEVTGGIHTYEDLNKVIKNAIDSKKWDVLKKVGIDIGSAGLKTAYDLFKYIGKLPDDKKTGTFLDKINIDDNFSAIVDDKIENQFLNELAKAFATKTGPLPNDFNINKELQTYISNKYNKRTVATLQEAKKKKKSGDRCTRIAKRKYDVWPSAYASGAVVKCRQGKIWKGVSENASNQEIDDALLLEEIEVVEEEWSEKYKRSIDCKNPKGFSQKAHCQGKKKNEDIDLGEVEILEEAKKKAYKPNFSKEKEQGLHGWFARNDGKGWVNCRTGGPCGRDSADKGGKYPACRPTKAQCKSAGKGPLRKKKSSSPISWTKKKKD